MGDQASVDKFILGEHDPSRHRVFRDAHMVKKMGNRIQCQCGWAINVSPVMDLEMAEELAYLHRTKPELIIAESTDVDINGRRSRLS